MLNQMIAKFRGGVIVGHAKVTAEMATKELPPPKLLILPMQQHIGGICQPLVKGKDTVKAGEIIADSSAFVSAPIHAPVSGKIKSIKPLLMANGQQVEAIYLENDGEMNWVEQLPQKISNQEELVAAARLSGLVGIGGAGFPLHVKLAEKAPLDTLVINGAECEPFITSDYREARENPQRILRGMLTLMKHLEIQRGIIGIEDNKPLAIKEFKKILASEFSSNEQEKISVVPLASRYPQGAEKMLIYATTKRKVSPGKLPASIGCLVLNISTISLFQQYLDTGKPLVEKRVTLAGDNLHAPQNLLAPIGTPIQELIDFSGGLKEATGGKVILGGPMMGIAQFDLSQPITKQTNAITCLLPETAYQASETPCIRCGRCAKACPMNLLPLEIERALKNKEAKEMQALQVANCMECGCCAFVCPSQRRLVQYMRAGKTIARGNV